MTLETFVSHKVVQAAKIVQAVVCKDGVLLFGQSGEPVTLPLSWNDRHCPVAGGYLVLYADSYYSFSPAAAFEEGYRRPADVRAETVERIARTCHEVNRAYCASLGDLSQLAWDDAPEWQRASAREGVRLVLDGVGGPKDLHAAWAVAKRRDGWTYGPEKDAEAKTHPCLVDYDNLPAAQRVKDDLFLAVVDAQRVGQ